jgi:hypothetical protein
MSLILEALKKLEREKQAGERGLVVLSHLPWVGAQTGRGGLVAASVAVLALILLVLGAAGIWQWRGAGARPTANAPLSGNTSTAVPAARSAPPVGPAAGASVLTPGSPIAPPAARTDTRTVAARPELPATRLPLPVAAPTPLPDAPVVPAGPTDPGHGPTPSKPGEIHLNAISVRDGHPVAILNDRLVREGDSFDGIRVLRIGEAEVEVEVGGVRRILTF